MWNFTDLAKKAQELQEQANQAASSLTVSHLCSNQPELFSLLGGFLMFDPQSRVLLLLTSHFML